MIWHPSATKPPMSIQASINYTVDSGETLVNETFGPNNIRRRTIGPVDVREMKIQDGRVEAKDFWLERNGFQLVPHRTAMKSFFDPEELKSVYYPEVERLIRDVSGASRV